MNGAETITILGETNFRNQRRKFGIKLDDRRRHTYLIGKTGMGKSTLIENMVIQDIVNGNGVALIDPHGEAAENVLNYIPKERVNDVVYFNPADTRFPIAFNVMEVDNENHKHLIASGLVGVFKKLWADSWGPRLEYLLRNAILALLDYPGATLLGVPRLFIDKDYQQKVISKIKDPVVKAFWTTEYRQYGQQFQVEAISPIQNKVGQFLSISMIRNIIGQSKSTVDIRQAMDEKKILILNLAKGRIGEDSSALLGAMMITNIQLAAMSRVDIPEDERTDFYLYVDEFQNFATESFAGILSEARKYRLNLIIAHQYIEQLDDMVRAAVFGNVGTLVCFRVGATDAEFLAQEFEPYFTLEDLVNLAKFEVYLKLMIDGVASKPFSAGTLPIAYPRQDNADKIIKQSRERYAKDVDVVADKIMRWSTGSRASEEQKPDKPQKKKARKEEARAGSEKKFTPANKAPKNKNSGSEKQSKPHRTENKTAKAALYVDQCYNCGQETELNFIPDGIRPVYCQVCFQEIRHKDRAKAKTQNPSSKNSSVSLNEATQQEPILFDKGQSPQPIRPGEVINIE